MGPLLINTLWRSYATKLTGPQMTLMARGLPKKEPIIGVKDIIVVASGKGGVGKSTVAANFACSMAGLGKRVGLLDGDIFGPTIPLLMNVHGEPVVNDRNLMIPAQNYNVKCLSMGMLTPVETSVIWRGPLVMSAIRRLLKGKLYWSNSSMLEQNDTIITYNEKTEIRGRKQSLGTLKRQARESKKCQFKADTELNREISISALVQRVHTCLRKHTYIVSNAVLEGKSLF
ncbi:iron-sulfur protein NUBPL isoform X2 [Drosophila yakuba]|uniref:iron-sulfur protein NUBPL isoform X2 n=1 Tax=Drosophila yakuba TaxID=7245 RepID=UPI0019308563|nr:iron-sulfur protein NUBPL isoform X2 [Drosophila yakuba]